MCPTKQKMSNKSDEDQGEEQGFRRRLLAWFDENQRDLPWRYVDDPYAVWVSEIMLQQTRVTTVLDYYERWMKRFPTVEDLAEANIEEVLELWSGLGYYRRARHLHRAAAMVVEEYGGELPQSVKGLKTLTGIGDYTAGAIASIAFGQVEPLVDGNVMRVISRYYARDEDPKRGAGKRFIWEQAGRLVDPGRPGDFNQGLMELGSLVCTAKSPKCSDCPVRGGCQGFACGDPSRFPPSATPTRQRPMRGRVCVVHRVNGGEAEFLLRRRPADGLLAGLWEFPTVEVDGKNWPTVEELHGWLAEESETNQQQDLSKEFGEIEHVFSHRRLKVKIHQWDVSALHWSTSGRRWRWVSEGELSGVASSALLGKVKRLWTEKSEDHQQEIPAFQNG